MIKKGFFLLLILFSQRGLAQKYSIYGKVQDQFQHPLSGVNIILKNTLKSTYTDSRGIFEIKYLHQGNYKLVVYCVGKKEKEQELQIPQQDTLLFILDDINEALKEVVIEGEKEKRFGITSLKSIDNFGIYEGKKSEVVLIKDINANLATNNARQVYSKVTGLNIWESDQAGLQLGIGGRGLSPDRSSNFNVRQNGYDISADALGYPEAYYTPPLEAVEKIEIVRGAASLQYGTQFGGLVNFKMRNGSNQKKMELVSRQSIGAWGFWGTSNSLGGTVAKLNYYTYYQYRTGNGYRANSGFYNHHLFSSWNYKFNQKLSVQFDFTYMNYLTQQAGGLTDRLFSIDPRQSLRARNWFTIDWKLFSLAFTYKLSDKTQFNWRNFGLLAYRQSVGNLERINVFDNGAERTVIDGHFQNIGTELRMIHHYQLFNQKNSAIVGSRLYSGNTTASQGNGSAAANADFRFNKPNNLENSDYAFPSQNLALFAENIIHLSPNFTLTPGLRWEYIQTQAKGYYKQTVKDAAGNIIVDNKISEANSSNRNFLLMGLGVKYQLAKYAELYANFSQNYRAINFSDLRINNPNIRIDSNLKDEKGYTADIGIKGSKNATFTYEATFFYLAYQGKIGQILKTDPVLFNDFRFRTNIADARNIGLELFGELALQKLWNKEEKAWSYTIFSNIALIDARYINTENTSIKNKKVEMVPPTNIKTGTTISYKKFSTTFQYSFVGSHFSDATNANRTATAIEGIINAYQVADLSMKYSYKWFGMELSVSNIFNESYFTRRAESYPGPGIIPADGRGFYATLQFKY